MVQRSVYSKNCMILPNAASLDHLYQITFNDIGVEICKHPTEQIEGFSLSTNNGISFNGVYLSTVRTLECYSPGQPNITSCSGRRGATDLNSVFQKRP